MRRKLAALLLAARSSAQINRDLHAILLDGVAARVTHRSSCCVVVARGRWCIGGFEVLGVEAIARERYKSPMASWGEKSHQDAWSRRGAMLSRAVDGVEAEPP